MRRGGVKRKGRERDKEEVEEDEEDLMGGRGRVCMRRRVQGR